MNDLSLLFITSDICYSYMTFIIKEYSFLILYMRKISFMIFFPPKQRFPMSPASGMKYPADSTSLDHIYVLKEGKGIIAILKLKINVSLVTDVKYKSSNV